MFKEFSFQAIVVRSVKAFLARPHLYFGLSILVHLPFYAAFILSETRSLGDSGSAILTRLSLHLIPLMLLPFVTASVACVETHASLSFSKVVRALSFALQRSLGLTFCIIVLTYMGLLLWMLPGVVAYAFLSFAIPTCLYEKTHFTQSLRRSATLAKNHRLGFFGYALFFFVFQHVINETFLGPPLSVGAPLIASVAMMLTSTLLAPLIALFTTYAYRDFRIFGEGASPSELSLQMHEDDNTPAS